MNTSSAAYRYDELVWGRDYLAPMQLLIRRQDAEKLRTMHGFPPELLLRDESDQTVSLALGRATGKVTDCGYDQTLCHYTNIPADADFSFEAAIVVDAFAEDGTVRPQEAFGLFYRDTMEQDPQTGYHYSNMVAVGGFLGQANVFGRCGIASDGIEDVRNLTLHPTAPDEPALQIGPSAPRSFDLKMQRRGDIISFKMTDEHGNDALTAGVGTGIDPAFERHGDGAWTLTVPAGTFDARRHDFSYIGFLVARGSAIRIEKQSVRVNICSGSTRDIELSGQDAPNLASATCEVTSPRSSKSVNNHTISPIGVARIEIDPELTGVYASPDGTVSGTGTQDEPLDLQTALDSSLPHQDICLLPGTYRPTGSIVIHKGNDGTPMRPRRLRKFGSHADIAIIDFAGADAFLDLQADYWELSGLIVTRGLGIRIQGSHNIVSHCMAVANRECGMLIRHEDNDAPRNEWPSYNTVTSCVACRNRDDAGQNADGFGCKVTNGEGNRFIRCFSYLNVDDGFDLFTKNRMTGSVTLTSCESYLNGYAVGTDGSHGEIVNAGNGFKLGGSGMAVDHRAVACKAIGNAKYGFSSNSNPYMTLVSCTAHDNGRENVHFYFTSPTAPWKRRLEHCMLEDSEDFDRDVLLKNLVERFEKALPTWLFE